MIKIIKEEDNIDYKDPGFDIDIADNFSKDIYYLLDELVEKSNVLNETFISPKCRDIHYKEHCKGDNKDKKSRRTKVYYDFIDKGQYVEYEKHISSLIANTEYNISSLNDYEMIISYFRKLFEGNVIIRFSNSCGIRNKYGPVNISLHAFSSNVTTNYPVANTIDICVKSTRDKTITLYSVDAHYLQTKINNIINKYSSYTGKKFHFNND